MRFQELNVPIRLFLERNHSLGPNASRLCGARAASLDATQGPARSCGRGASHRRYYRACSAIRPLWLSQDAELLRQAGWTINDKRVERIWQREGLKVPHKQPKRGRLWLADGSCIRLWPEQRNHDAKDLSTPEWQACIASLLQGQRDERLSSRAPW